MKITKINVESFGAVKGFFAEFGDNNLTLVYGDNESGKTTITEFIRSTLFPGRPAKYPVPRKTDSGSVFLTMADGTTRELIREQKKVWEKDDKPLPSQDLNMDSETYRSLFALDIDKLADDKIISNGEFRKRFLTVPGGEHIPEIDKSITQRMDELLSRGRITETREIGCILKEMKVLEEEIAIETENVEAFDSLNKERQHLIAALTDAKTANQSAIYENNKEQMLETLKENVGKLDALKEERNTIVGVEKITDQLVSRINELKSKIEALDSLIAAQKEGQNSDAGKMEAAEILSYSDEIESLWSERGTLSMLEDTVKDLELSIESDDSKISEAVSEYGVPVEIMLAFDSDPSLDQILEKAKIREKVGKKESFIAGSITAMAGLITAIAGIYWLSILFFIIAGGAFAFPTVADRMSATKGENNKLDALLEKYRLPSGNGRYDVVDNVRKTVSIYRRRGLSEERHETFLLELEKIRSRCKLLCKKLGAEYVDAETSLDDIYGVYVLAKTAVHTMSESVGLDEKHSEATKELESLLSQFGGEEGYLTLLSNKKRADELDFKIKTLEDTVESTAGMTAEILSKSVDSETMSREETEAAIDSINIRIGEINMKMKHTIDTDTLGKNKSRLESLNTKLNDAVMEWAVLSLSESIIAQCSNHLYSKLQPSVLKTANNYLDLMTDGRYRLTSDPRDSEIGIEDKQGRKYDGEWSSGLGDQVYLAVKMAIAKELGKERLPFIMDDVLVRFDNYRKQGACKAILEFAKDQQAVMFTCDSSLVSLFKLEGQINYIKLP